MLIFIINLRAVSYASSEPIDTHKYRFDEHYKEILSYKNPPGPLHDFENMMGYSFLETRYRIVQELCEFFAHDGAKHEEFLESCYRIFQGIGIRSISRELSRFNIQFKKTCHGCFQKMMSEIENERNKNSVQFCGQSSKPPLVKPEDITIPLPSYVWCVCPPKPSAFEGATQLYHALYDDRGLLRCFDFDCIAGFKELPHRPDGYIHTDVYACFRVLLNDCVQYDKYLNEHPQESERMVALIGELTNINPIHLTQPLVSKSSLLYYDQIVYQTILSWAQWTVDDHYYFPKFNTQSDDPYLLRNLSEYALARTNNASYLHISKHQIALEEAATKMRQCFSMPYLSKIAEESYRCERCERGYNA